MKPTKIVPDSKYPSMYRLQWADGALSADFYNRTRANDILRNYDRYMADMATAERMKGNKIAAGRFPRVVQKSFEAEVSPVGVE